MQIDDMVRKASRTFEEKRLQVEDPLLDIESWLMEVKELAVEEVRNAPKDSQPQSLRLRELIEAARPYPDLMQAIGHTTIGELANIKTGLQNAIARSQAGSFDEWQFQCVWSAIERIPLPKGWSPEEVKAAGEDVWILSTEVEGDWLIRSTPDELNARLSRSRLAPVRCQNGRLRHLEILGDKIQLKTQMWNLAIIGAEALGRLLTFWPLPTMEE